MRKADRVEIKASGGFHPEAAVRASINRSEEAWAAYVGEVLLAVYGVTVMPNCAIPWMLTSESVEQHTMTFWRASKEIIDGLRTRYPLMLNMVDARYAAALRWAERLGFKLFPPEPYGVEGRLFCRIVMETPKLVVAHV